MPPAEPRSLRVDLVAPPFAGHLFPLLAIGRHLASRGDEPRVLTGPRGVELARRCGLPARALAADRPDAMERIADPRHRLHGHPVRQLRQLRGTLDLMAGLRPEVERLLEERWPDVVVADFCAPVAGWAAEDLGLPWITTIPTPFALETRRATPSYLGGWAPPRGVAGRWRDAVGRRVVRAAKRLVEHLFARRLGALGRSLYRPDGSESAYSPSTILGLGATELELDRDWPEAFRMIGPITEAPVPGDGPPPPDLSDHAPERSILVTLGTHLHWARPRLLGELRTLLAAFPHHRFVISGGRIEDAATTPEASGPGWALYGWIPYDRCLDRFAAVVHHGGAGVTYAALEARRPSLVCPRDYDQFDFAARVEAAGVGRRVRRLDSGAAVRALGSLLAGDAAERLSAVAAAIGRYRPLEEARDAISAAAVRAPTSRSPRRSGRAGA